jgi:hypothetical protein
MVKIRGLIERRPAFALALVAILAFVAGFRAWNRGASTAIFYQTEFTAAVSLACAKGWMAVDGEKQAIIANFLAGKTTSMTCASAFSEANAPVLARPALFHHQIVSAQYLFAGLWRVYGFSWDVAALAGGMLLALTAAAVYLFSRQLLGPWPSVAVAALLSLRSWPFQEWVPHLRDFSKAPFLILLASLSVSALFAERRRLVPLSAFAGLVAGIGMGFRTDVSLFLVVMPLALLLRACDRESTAPAIAGLVAFAAGAALVDRWLHYSAGLGHNTAHFMVLGRYLGFMRALGFGDDYQGLMTHYSDGLAHQLVSFFSTTAGQPAPGYGTPDYDRAGRAFLLEYAKLFPADLLLLAITAAYKSMFAFAGATSLAQAGAFLAAFVILPTYYRWRGLAVLAVAVFLAGMTGVQFDPRHYFHVQAFGVVLLVGGAIAVLDGIARLVPIGTRERAAVERWRQWFAPPVQAPDRRVALAMLALLATTLLAIVVARSHQTREVTRLLDSLRAMPAEPLAPAAVSGDPAMRVFHGDAIAQSSYLRLSLEPADQCRRMPEVEVVYTAIDPSIDWSYQLVRPTGTVRGAFFPALWTEGTSVSAIKVSRLDAGCEAHISRIKPTSKLLPLVLFDGAERVSRYFQSDIAAPLAQLQGRLRKDLGPTTCPVSSKIVRGRDPAALVETTARVPRYIMFDVGDARDGIGSDHFDAGEPELVVAGRTWRIAELAIVSKSSEALPMRIDANILGKPLRIGNNTFSHGFGLHANGHVHFETPRELRGKPATLRFHYGIDAQTEGAGSVSVSVCLVR